MQNSQFTITILNPYFFVAVTIVTAWVIQMIAHNKEADITP